MKLSRSQFFSGSELDNLWQKAALDMTLEYGIIVKANHEWVEGNTEGDNFIHLFFQVKDLKFECLKDLRKALNNKAFL
jgi:hypothetical protein